ncbi:MAG: cysteine protease [Proteobacteria bacterium]|nr:cysteine protease [Pseudomonadota bacterium]
MIDIYDALDFGYDPSVPENIPVVTPPRPAAAPPSKNNVNPQWLPPVGKQTTPSCFVWASTYGLTTFGAAQANNLDPTQPQNQASPIYTYIKVEQQQGEAANSCSGGKIAWCFDFLNTTGGTASMANAPDETGCQAAWTSWGGATLQPDSIFQVTDWKSMTLEGAAGLDNMRALITAGTPFAFGAWLYTDFVPYRGNPVPYVGNHTWAQGPNGKVGHVMMVIGYDNNCGPNGAVLVQNSFGTGWGSQWNGAGGYVWIDYNTFQTIAQGTGVYITQMGAAKG